MVGFRGQRSTKTPARIPRMAMGSMYAIWTPVTCWAVAWCWKVRTLMTAKSARKSPKTETTCAYQRRRIMGMRITSPIESGAGSSGSMGGFGIDSAGAGLGEVVLMRGELMVLDCGSDSKVRRRQTLCGRRQSGKLSHYPGPDGTANRGT